jgi:hypothetical protein
VTESARQELFGRLGLRRRLKWPGAALTNADILGQFLCNTLVEKLVAHERGGIAYHSLRRWRATLKPYQVEALTGVKIMPSEAIVDVVAAELLSAVRKLYGSHGVRNVVPIPPGSSGNANSFSVQIARCLAAHLHAEFSDVLAAPVSAARGRSHPKKSAMLKPYALQRPLEGFTLLVDDVASSGRHLELGLKALRASAIPVIGLAWIGP